MSEPRDLTTLERELEQLKRQLPRHSVPMSLLVRIEELEEEIAARKKFEVNVENIEPRTSEH
ncbi:MAG: hypothetical protein N2559_10955 [Anaerolineae bacterium]|nr:hypothetical protein [Anaerolineae bacterium]